GFLEAVGHSPYRRFDATTPRLQIFLTLVMLTLTRTTLLSAPGFIFPSIRRGSCRTSGGSVRPPPGSVTPYAPSLRRQLKSRHSFTRTLSTSNYHPIKAE